MNLLLPLRLSLSLSLYLPISLSLSIVMFEFEPLYKKRKRKKEERGEGKNYPLYYYINRLVCVCEVWWQSVLICRNSITKPVRTCRQYSDHVRSSHNVNFCTFESSYSSVLRPILLKLQILTCLIERELSNGVWVMALY